MALSKAQLMGIIRTHKSKSLTERKEWDKWRSWYMSEYWNQSAEQPTGSSSMGQSSDEEINFETNYPYAYIDTMIANICPQNPQVTVMSRGEEHHEAAQFREALINDTFSRNNLHQILWKAATNAAICGRALMKTVWNFRKNNIDIFEVDPRFVFFDMSAKRWEDIRYLVEVTVLTEAEFKGRVKRKGKKGALYNSKAAKKADFGGFPTWLRDKSRSSHLMNEASRAVYRWVTVYEVYDFTGEGKYYHCLDDVEEPLFSGELPYRYVQNPFTFTTFNDNMTDLGGLSDIKLIQSLQARLNEIDTLELWHAHTSTPVMMVNTALADNPEDILTALQQANEPGSMIQVRAKQGAPLGDIIGHTPTPSISPSFGDMRERCNGVIEFILGIPQYSRGVVGVADVATEVALADTATRTRNGRRIKMIEDNIQALATRIIGLYEEFLESDKKLAIRLMDTHRILNMTRESLKLKTDRDPFEDPLEYDYAALPYSPTENHKLVQLQKLQQYMPLLLQSPAVDQEKLITKLLDLLQMRDILASPADTPPAPPGMPPGPPQPGLPGGPPEAPPMGPPMDNISTGALPPGLEGPPMPMPMGGPGMPGPTGGLPGMGGK